MTNYLDWTDGTQSYRYWFLETPSNAASIKREAGNYVFAKRLANGNFTPLYFGVADDLSARIPQHDRWDDAVRAGATHVLAHTTPVATARLAEEKALIAYWNPPLNTQHRQVR